MATHALAAPLGLAGDGTAVDTRARAIAVALLLFALAVAGLALALALPHDAATQPASFLGPGP